MDELDEVPDGFTVVFSAHGIAPAVQAEANGRGLRSIDATCPLVTKVHQEVVRNVEAGHEMVLIGHAGHDEVLGTMGEAPGRIRLVTKWRTWPGWTFPPKRRWPTPPRPP